MRNGPVSLHTFICFTLIGRRWPGNICVETRLIRHSGERSAPIIQRKRLAFGGCNFVEDPALDARDVDPTWAQEPSSVLRLIRDDFSAGLSTFSFWKMTGAKRVVHDGARLRISGSLGPRALRVWVADGVYEGGSFAYAVSGGANLPDYVPLLSAFTSLMKSDSPAAARTGTCVRPTRIAVMHMRALQALDGTLAGASQREIAIAIFGEHVVAERWQPDSELRAQTRHLIRLARKNMLGGYRHLLAPSGARQGDGGLTAESP